MHNPLKRPILEILKNTITPLKEHDLHGILGGAAFASFIDHCNADLRLFRKHFLVMNALYTLHEELLCEGFYLQISALHIQLQKIPEAQSDVHSLSNDAGFARLSDYYRNWDNFKQTSGEDVSNLLQQFWRRFLAEDEKSQALSCLQLSATADWSEIQYKYRQLCQQHHPDKGGNSLYFIEIREAYDNLKTLYRDKKKGSK